MESEARTILRSTVRCIQPLGRSVTRCGCRLIHDLNKRSTPPRDSPFQAIHAPSPRPLQGPQTPSREELVTCSCESHAWPAGPNEYLLSYLLLKDTGAEADALHVSVAAAITRVSGLPTSPMHNIGSTPELPGRLLATMIFCRAATTLCEAIGSIRNALGWLPQPDETRSILPLRSRGIDRRMTCQKG